MRTRCSTRSDTAKPAPSTTPSAKNNPQLERGGPRCIEIYAAVCDFKLKHLSRRDVERLPETSDDTAALKLYMLAELSRNEDDRPGMTR